MAIVNHGKTASRGPDASTRPPMTPRDIASAAGAGFSVGWLSGRLLRVLFDDSERRGR